ncbi:PorT family protein [Chitinophaga agrisoli]|uniref:PorT family protein n=1 Tax=Chitinophaga agrisoli TaxID=2607653 RepID=A0A5B2VVW3_9BACT|nr:porin family protein [Chitinophaga agrisoli]KAA2243235.1 PorT family protein [Chitinophaga agrisoli]
MKNYASLVCFAVLLLLLHPHTAQAQIDLGIKAGLSIPNLSSGSSANPINSGYGSRLGPDIAIHAEFHITSRFSIQPELRYSAQGGKKNGNQAFSVPPELQPMFPPGTAPQYLYADYKSTAKINYLMLPVLAKYHFLPNGPWDLYAALGPFVSLRVSAKNITSGSSNIYLDETHMQPMLPSAQSFDRKEDIKDEIRPINAGIDGHIGIAYRWKRCSVFLEGGGNYGFINIQKNDINGKNNTGAAVIAAGYAFRIGR